MSGKSQRRKHSTHSKKSKVIERSKSSVLQSPIVAQTTTPTVVTKAPARRTEVTSSKTVRYPFISAELKRISILAGIILAILVVLALILS